MLVPVAATRPPPRHAAAIATDRQMKRSRRAAAAPTGPFDIPAAPLLVPDGPWKHIDGGVCAAKGFRAAGMAAGLRAVGPKADLALVWADEPAVAAGTFTKNLMCAAPVTFTRRALEMESKGLAQAVLINAGQANAATGEAGYRDCVECAAGLAIFCGVAPAQSLILSTGVIGRRIKKEELLTALPDLFKSLGATPRHALEAAVAVTTTDLVSKSAALEVDVNGTTVRLGGFAKGSGMIHPNMATMLAVVTCDAAVEPRLWRRMLSAATDASFNQITVDGDSSTNDTVIALASGAAGGARLASERDPGAAALQAALTALLQGLAKAIAWDGEGATCLIECRVAGAASDGGARAVARSVVASSLTKAAVFGHDPNWGRIACAAGYAGVEFDPDALDITLGPTPLMRAGQPVEFDAVQASAYLKDTTAVHGTVMIDLRLGSGPGSGVAWGCDLSYDYVKINADYTT